MIKKGRKKERTRACAGSLGASGWSPASQKKRICFFYHKRVLEAHRKAQTPLFLSLVLAMRRRRLSRPSPPLAPAVAAPLLRRSTSISSASSPPPPSRSAPERDAAANPSFGFGSGAGAIPPPPRLRLRLLVFHGSSALSVLAAKSYTGGARPILTAAAGHAATSSPSRAGVVAEPPLHGSISFVYLPHALSLPSITRHTHLVIFPELRFGENWLHGRCLFYFLAEPVIFSGSPFTLVQQYYLHCVLLCSATHLVSEDLSRPLGAFMFCLNYREGMPL